MIPKILHHVWLGPMQVPELWINSWKDLHPDWEDKVWTEEEIDFPLTCIRQFLLSKTYAGKADILRYEILWRYGGIYLDADSLCLRPLDDELLSRNFLAVYENENVRPGLVANGVIGCGPEHPFVREMIHGIVNMLPGEMNEYDYVATGPKLVTKTLVRHACNEILPSFLFYPYHYTGEKCSAEQLEEAYAIQMWGSTVSLSDEFKSMREGYGYHTTTYCGRRVPEPLKAIQYAVVRQNPEYRIQQHEGQVALESAMDGCKISLSETARLVWALCSEKVEIQAVTDALISAFPGYSEDIRRDVCEMSCDLIHRGMLLVDPE